jgi:hypothetical protein
MIKNSALNLINNLKTNKEVRSDTFRLVGELSNVVTSVTSLNDNQKLQNIIAKTTLGYSTYVALRSLSKIIRDNSKPRFIERENEEYYVRVFATDVLYNAVEGYINENTVTKHLPMEEMVMKTFNSHGFEDDDFTKAQKALVENNPTNQGVTLYRETYPETTINLKFGGHPVVVDKVDPVPPPTPKMNMTMGGYIEEEVERDVRPRSKRTQSLQRKLELHASYLFKCKSLEAQKAVVDFLYELGPKAHGIGKENQSGYRGHTELYVAREDGRGDWANLPARTPETVILPDRLMEEIVGEIKKFLQYESIYTMLGVPYHHGIMLAGAPGTGKSSAAQAIASALQMTTYVVSLSTIESNAAFTRFIEGVGSNSIVLIEDIDAAKAAKPGDTDVKGVTREVLLNVLDGISSPHGCLFIVTTNHPEKLDEAIVRPGRIDATYDITYLVDEQFERLCKKFMMLDPYEKLDLPSVEGLKITPAAVIGEIKSFIPNLSEALPRVIEFVNEKRAEQEAHELVAA